MDKITPKLINEAADILEQTEKVSPLISEYLRYAALEKLRLQSRDNNNEEA